jgi:hypothetical protein
MVCHSTKGREMKPTGPQICSAIKFREDEQKIYWRVRTADGGTRYVSFYWGALPTERLEKFLKWINAPTINNRKKICRMVALPKLPKDKLRDSDFLKNEIFERLELRQRHGKFFNKPSRFSPEQIAELGRLVNDGFADFKLGVKKIRKGSIKVANHLRKLGEGWETLTGHRRFFMRDFLKFQSSLPGDNTPHFWRLALSTWRNNPSPIDNYCLARNICVQAGLPTIPH